MTAWQVIAADRRTMYCPIALELRDEFAGILAFGKIRLALEYQNGTLWTPSGTEPVLNNSGIFVYPGLGRAIDPAALPGFRVRVRIEADFYRAAYVTTDDAIEFDIPTYNDAVPPAVSPLMPEVVLMLPNSAYPFSDHVRLIHGRVLDAGGDPVADAMVQADGVERVITGENGAFSLPLRWQTVTANVNIQVDHPRSGLGAAVVLTLPAALNGNQDITVT